MYECLAIKQRKSICQCGRNDSENQSQAEGGWNIMASWWVDSFCTPNVGRTLGFEHRGCSIQEWVILGVELYNTLRLAITMGLPGPGLPSVSFKLRKLSLDSETASECQVSEQFHLFWMYSRDELNFGWGGCPLSRVLTFEYKNHRPMFQIFFRLVLIPPHTHTFN